jgi:L-threonylcarbamoyladenylate synthase
MAARAAIGIVDALSHAIDRAVALLQAGELVAFPTETVYGLGRRRRQPAAVARIFAAKGRPADHPLIVHLPADGYLDRWARDIPPWPGNWPKPSGPAR